MTKHSNIYSIIKDEKKISSIFLGVGLTLFFLNISTFLSFLPKEYSYMSFDLSIFSSIIIIIYSVYILEHKK